MISLFSSFTDKQPKDSTLADIVNLIRSDEKTQMLTESYRLTHEKRVKESSYAFAVAAILKNGKSKDNVTGLTGLSLVDVDHVSLARPLSNSPRGGEDQVESLEFIVKSQNELECSGVQSSSDSLRSKKRTSSSVEFLGNQANQIEGRDNTKELSTSSTDSTLELARLTPQELLNRNGGSDDDSEASAAVVTTPDRPTPSGGREGLSLLKEIAESDPHTLLCYRTISGEGLRIVYRYALDASYELTKQMQYYPKAFATGNDYYAKLLGVATDGQCKNVTRLSGLAHDPEVYYNPDAVPFSVEEIEAATHKETQRFNEQRKRQREKRRLQTYYEKVIRPEVEADGANYAPGHHNNYVMRVGYKLNQFGFSQDIAEAWAATTFIDYPDAAAIIRSCYARTEEFGTRSQHLNEHKRQEKTELTKAEMIASFLRDQPLRYDVISRKIQALAKADEQHSIVSEADTPHAEVADQGNQVWKELTERDQGDLFVACNKALGHNIQLSDLRAVLHSTVVPEVNPLREYIYSLPEWDGVSDAIAEVAAMVTVTDAEEQALWARCFKKWFVAMVASWMNDDVVNHQVIVLIGEQGIYKTTWLDALMPPELVQYRCRQSGARVLDKDEQLRASEFGLINMDEIDRMNETELNALKSLITSTDINVRAAYAQNKERRLRVASYVASGNKERFLTDTTGNRRWLPFHIESIASPFEHPLPYATMYAQAWALIHQHYNFWFDTTDIRSLNEHVDAFMIETNEEQLLPVYFTPCEPGTPGAQLLTVAEISAKLTLYGNIRKSLDMRQLGSLLKKKGFVRARGDKNSTRGYIVLENSADAINSERRLKAMQPDAAPHAPHAPYTF